MVVDGIGGGHAEAEDDAQSQWRHILHHRLVSLSAPVGFAKFSLLPCQSGIGIIQGI